MEKVLKSIYQKINFFKVSSPQLYRMVNNDLLDSFVVLEQQPTVVSLVKFIQKYKDTIITTGQKIADSTLLVDPKTPSPHYETNEVKAGQSANIKCLFGLLDDLTDLLRVAIKIGEKNGELYDTKTMVVFRGKGKSVDREDGAEEANAREYLEREIAAFMANDILTKGRCQTTYVYVESAMFEMINGTCGSVPGGRLKEILCKSARRLSQLKIEIDNTPPDSMSSDKFENHNREWRKFVKPFMLFIYSNYTALYGMPIIHCMPRFIDQQLQMVIEFNKEIRRLRENNSSIKKLRETIRTNTVPIVKIDF